MKTLTYFDHVARAQGDTPLDVVEWTPPPEPVVVEEHEATEEALAEFRRMLGEIK